MRLLVLLGTTLLLSLGSAGVAAAHSGGLASEPYLPRVLAVDPPVPGLSVAVVEGGARLALANDTALPVEVLPAGPQRAEEPVVEPGGRGHWADPRVATEAATWSVPLRVGDQQVTVRGETIVPPAPATAGWWALTAGLALGTALVGAVSVRRRAVEAVVAVLGLGAVAAHLVHVLGSASVPVDLPYWPTVLGTAGIGIGAWVAALTGAVLTAVGTRWGLLLTGIGGAVLALVTVSDTDSFADAVLPYAWDPTLDRVATAVTVGVGVGLFLTGFAALRAMTPDTLPGTETQPLPDPLPEETR
ncbi:hypothetical protein [Pseudonocardia xishanensis]|uniref:Uncharacterized protein n=1 Tax=Pseudonocardia xishanensis TaxID=630995 RepID=A0ABP8RTZ3_9PSEU